MSDKERLEKIKDRYMEREYDYALKSADIDWLIQQAERVQELNYHIEAERMLNKDLHKLQEFLQKNPDLSEHRYGESISLISLDAMKKLKKQVQNYNGLIRHYEQVLEEFAKHGTKHDTNPTLIMDDNQVFVLLNYIKNMDDYVRKIARQALVGGNEYE